MPNLVQISEFLFSEQKLSMKVGKNKDNIIILLTMACTLLKSYKTSLRKSLEMKDVTHYKLLLKITRFFHHKKKKMQKVIKSEHVVEHTWF